MATTPNTASPGRILVRVPNWIGDAVMTLPALSELKRIMPDSEITVLAKPRVAPVYERTACVSRVLKYDDKGIHAGFFGKIRLSGELRAEGFTHAVLFQNAFEAAFIAALARIPERAGYRSDGRGILLTRPIELPPSIDSKHDIFYYLGIVNGLGGEAPLEGELPVPRLCVTAEDEASAENILRRGRGRGAAYIGIAPGASYGPAKKWSAKNFADAANELSRRLGGAVPVIFGGPDDKEAANETSRLIAIEHENLAGKTTLAEFIALTKRMHVFITNDSGPMHVAAALGVPTVAIFGSTAPNLTRPSGRRVKVVQNKVECSPCFDRECRFGHYKCLTGVTVEEVVGAAAALTKEAAKTVVFLDRDGTLNEDTGYISDPAGLFLLPGAAEAIKALKEAGMKVFVVTNQSGVGRGYYKEEDVIAVNERLRELLLLEGAAIDGIYYCVHAPDAGCACRKPKAGLVEKAILENGLQGAEIFVVGDKASDVELAVNAGGKGVLVLTGKGAAEKGSIRVRPALVAKDVREAAGWIIKETCAP